MLYVIPPLPFRQFFFCEILRLYTIVTPSIIKSVTSVNLKKADIYGQSKYCYMKNNTPCYDQLCSSLWTFRVLISISILTLIAVKLYEK